LLIVTGIIVVLSAVSVPQFATFGSKSEVVDYGSQIEALIDKGISSSLGSQISASGEIANGIRIRANLDNSTGIDKNSTFLDIVKYSNLDNPESSEVNVLSSEKIKLPDHMRIETLAGGGSGTLFAYFTAPTKYYKDSSLGDNNFAIRLVSDKTSKAVIIKIIPERLSKDTRGLVRVVLDE